jgi:TonB family protein
MVKFVVEKDGSIYDVDILKGGEAGTGEEVVRVVNMMPKWVPGKKDGKAVRTEFVLPVRFELDAMPGQSLEEKPLNLNDLDEAPVMLGCENLTGEERQTCSTNKLIETLFSNVKYPVEARKNGVEGTVFAKFTIEKDGSISHPEIIRRVGSGCDEEVLRVIGQMPKWSPGKKGGQPVAASFTLPVKFKLDTEERTILPDANSKADNPELLSLNIFPNPASDRLTVAYDVKTAVTLRVADATGKEVASFSLKATNGKEEFSTSMKDFPKGMLYMTLSDKNGKLLGTRVLMVE